MYCVYCSKDSTLFICKDCSNQATIEEICAQLIKYDLNDTSSTYLRDFISLELTRKSAVEVVGQIADTFPELNLTYFRLIYLIYMGPKFRQSFIELAENYITEQDIDKERYIDIAKKLVNRYIETYEFYKAIDLADRVMDKYGIPELDLAKAECLLKLRLIEPALQVLETRLEQLIQERENGDFLITRFQTRYDEYRDKLVKGYIYTPNNKEGKEKLNAILQREGRYTETVSIPLSTSLEHDSFVAFDFETTGFSNQDAIIEIGAVKVVGGEITDRFSRLINPGRPIPLQSTAVHGITDEMVAAAPKLYEAFPDFIRFIEGCTLLAHNAGFDCRFLARDGLRFGRTFAGPVLDTMLIAKKKLPHLPSYKLGYLTNHFGIALTDAHRAWADAEATAKLYLIMRGL